MMLMTKEIKKALPPLYSTEGTYPVKPVAVKFFTPWTNWTWYVFEGEEIEDGDFMFFGMVEGNFTEAGNFTLSQLEEINGPFGLKVERDRGFTGDYDMKSKKVA